MTIGLVCLIVALILSLLAAFGVPRGGTTVQLFPLAFAFFVLALLVGGADLAASHL
jgi:hypothetical protein